MKRFKNVRNNFICCFLSLFLILGCSNTLDVKTSEQEKIKLELSAPDPISMKKVNWYVITKENSDSVFQNLKNKNKDLVLFGLTDDNYKNLSLNMAELKKYIIEQKVIIKGYVEYYESE